MSKKELEAKGELSGEAKTLTDVATIDGEIWTINQHVYIGSMPDFANDAERQKFRARYTFQVAFDFANVTERERLAQLVSQTTYRKMWYNNDVRPNTAKDKETGETVWTNDDIESLANGEQPAFRVSIRELLDGRKTRTADPVTKAKKAAGELKKFAMHLSAEQKAELAAMLQG